MLALKTRAKGRPMTGGSRITPSLEDTNAHGILISLISVCYNSVNSISATIESVISQKYEYYEYIVIDGGSTDGTVEILRKYAAHINYWISEPDAGIYDAMNKGIRRACGALIGILNSDDTFTDETVLGKINEAYCSSGASIIHSNINVIYPSGRIRIQVSGEEGSLTSGMHINHCTCFIAKKLYAEKLYDSDLKTTADYEFLLWSYLNRYKFFHLDCETVNFSASGTTGRPSLGDFEGFKIYLRYFGIFRALLLYLRDILPKLVLVPIKLMLKKIGLY